MKKGIGFIGLGQMGRRMALVKGLGGENKGAMIKVWEEVFGISVRRK